MVHARRVNKVVGMLLAFVMVLSTMFCTGAFAANAAGTNGFQEGTYTGVLERHVDAMDADVTYDVEMTFAGGNYHYDLELTVNGKVTDYEPQIMSYSCDGKYQENADGSLILTAESVSGINLQKVTVTGEGTIKLIGQWSSFGGTEIDLTLQNSESNFQEGTYYGTYTDQVSMSDAGVVIEYDIEITFAEGNYEYSTSYFIPAFMTKEEALEYSETGTYKVNGNNLTLSGGQLQSAAVQDDGTLSLTGLLTDNSSYAGSVATVSLSQKSYADTVASGNYVLTADSYPEDTLMKKEAYIVIDREDNSFIIHPYENGVVDLNTNKGSGTFSFNKGTGVYTMNYIEGVKEPGCTTTFTAAENGITFTSPMYYGIAKINTASDDHGFIPYTAKLFVEEPVVHEDAVASGNYVLTENDYPTGEGVAMKMPAYIVINRENETFNIHPYTDGVADLDTNKGSGTISFDEKTGVYTMTYKDGVKNPGCTSTFIAAENGITFTSPLYYGIAKINIVDAEDNFLSYTAKLEPAVYEDTVVSGNYVLTADSYDESAMMKMPAYIVIDRENNTFIIHPYTDGIADLGTNKGSGTISFDEKTGVYTMTYQDGVKNPGCTSTFIAAEDGITFTSPMYYGISKMNTTDEEGNFISYTAKLLNAPVDPENPTDPVNPENPGTTPSGEEGEGTEPNNPSTGDSNHVALLAALLLVSGAGACATLYIRKKTVR